MEAARDSVATVVQQWHDLRPDLDVSPIEVIARMARIRSIVEAEQARVFGPAGISSADFPVLVTLRRQSAPFRATHTQLAAGLGLTAGTVTARVDRLVQLGLAKRQVDGADARVRWVELTPRGLELIDDLIPRHLAAEQELLSGIDAATRQRLAGDLSLLLADLEARYVPD